MMQLTFEAVKARETLRDAEIALRQAEDLLDAKVGLGVSLALINRISTAKRQVEAAKAALQLVELSDASLRH